METKILQITSARGPAECCLAVALTLKEMIAEIKRARLNYEIINRTSGGMNGTLSSALIKIEGEGADSFAETWAGVLLWICKSPYREFHKRKNWFIGINEINVGSTSELNERDITFQTMRSSGPGGQNVNKTETAVRAIHKPTGLFASCNTSRSQLQNKQLAIARLKEKYYEWQNERMAKTDLGSPWEKNTKLERGNAKRIYKGEKFIKQRNG